MVVWVPNYCVSLFSLQRLILHIWRFCLATIFLLFWLLIQTRLCILLHRLNLDWKVWMLVSHLRYIMWICFAFSYLIFAYLDCKRNLQIVLIFCASFCKYLQHYVMLENSSLLKVLADICLINSFLLVCVSYW